MILFNASRSGKRVWSVSNGFNPYAPWAIWRKIMAGPCKLICCILLIAVTGCNYAERDWKKAKESNTASAYTDFLAKHPTGLHVDEAKNSIDGIDWTAATTDNTFDAYSLYLAHHPDGKHFADAKAGIKNLPLHLAILSTAVAQRFQAYVGGGANIEPPEPMSFPFGGGGGMPLISISGGSAFLAGEIGSEDSTKKLIKIEVSIRNSTTNAQSFKIGDISLALSGTRMNDFAAVGYGDKLCAMSDDDKKKVKEIAVEVPPLSMRRLSYAFGPLSPESKQGELSLGRAEPVSFDIGKQSRN